MIFRIVFELIIFIFDRSSTRVCFTNFGNLKSPVYFFIPTIKYFLEKQKKSFRIIKYFAPDINFFSVFGPKSAISKSNAKKKFFFTGENVNKMSIFKNLVSYEGNCTELVDLSLGFDPQNNSKDNYLRFPLWLLYFFSPFDSKDLIDKKLRLFNKKYRKDKFCTLIARHDITKIRIKIFEAVSKIAPVDCPSLFLHNDDSLRERFFNDKRLYLQQYKFNICPENSICEGYVTEKIFESLYSGCIPIYTGWSRDPEPGVLNSDVILWFDLDGNNEYVLNEIKKLNENDRLFESFMNKNIFCDTAVDVIHSFLQNYLNKMEQLLID
jgi:hypothetical protein